MHPILKVALGAASAPKQKLIKAKSAKRKCCKTEDSINEGVNDAEKETNRQIDKLYSAQWPTKRAIVCVVG